MRFSKNLLVIFIIFAFISGQVRPAPVFAQTQAEKAAAQAELQKQLQDLQNEINQLQGQLKQTAAEKNTLNNKIKTLKNQQSVLNLQIQATNLQVNKLGGEIAVTEKSISDNANKVAQLRSEISGVMRVINQNDASPLLYTLVTKEKFSDVFTAYQDFARVSERLSVAVKKLKETNEVLAKQQQSLEVQQTDAENLLKIKGIQQASLTSSVTEQNTLLQQTKGKETDYQIALSDTQRRATEIRSRIYQLTGASSQITFGDALKIAQWAEGATGIRPAFLLAILTQESNLGKNVGTCNRPGDGPEKSWQKIMKPERDQEPFLQITASLGLDPNTTPVSCPMKDKNGKQIGWGGAMGAAQFIPSTWMGYKDKVEKLTGNSPANPWDIRDAFAASAIKLVAGGANGTYQGEWNAAMRYFSGSTNVQYRFYGDNVMATAEKYQKDIDALK